MTRVVGGQVAQQRRDSPGLLRSHAAERFVEDEEPCARGDQHGDFELALLAVAQMRGDGIGARGEAGRIERVGNLGFLFLEVAARAEAQRFGVARLGGDQAVLARGEGRMMLGRGNSVRGRGARSRAAAIR